MQILRPEILHRISHEKTHRQPWYERLCRIFRSQEFEPFSVCFNQVRMVACSINVNAVPSISGLLRTGMRIRWLNTATNSNVIFARSYFNGPRVWSGISTFIITFRLKASEARRSGNKMVNSCANIAGRGTLSKRAWTSTSLSMVILNFAIVN